MNYKHYVKELRSREIQTNTVKRIEEICKEFDDRVAAVGLAIARLELAKYLAEIENKTIGIKQEE